jgi:hypothetical protein
MDPRPLRDNFAENGISSISSMGYRSRHLRWYIKRLNPSLNMILFGNHFKCCEWQKPLLNKHYNSAIALTPELKRLNCYMWYHLIAS